jgi:SAM-dependent methyltransferase
VARDLIPTLGPTLVEAAGVRAGQRVLDVGAGSGNAAIPAAVTGAAVTASDLTSELFTAGRHTAAERRVKLDWVEADAEALPFPDASFDVVLSCVGAMFAPAPPGRRRRNPARHRAGRHDRDDQLDARRVHREPVRDDETVRATASARREPAAAVGRRAARPRTVRGPGHRTAPAATDHRDGPHR